MTKHVAHERFLLRLREVDGVLEFTKTFEDTWQDIIINLL